MNRKIRNKNGMFTATMLMFFSLATVFVMPSLSAQITREQADTTVRNHLQNENVQYEVLYVNVNAPNEEGIAITTSNGEMFKAKYSCFAYYLNESDISQSRFLFVKTDQGNLLEVIAYNALVQDLSQWQAMDDDVGLIEKEGNPIRPILFPNPVNDWLNLPGYGERTRVEIFDANGKSLYSGFLSGENNNRVNVSALNPGVYLVNIYGEQNVVYKFIKL